MVYGKPSEYGPGIYETGGTVCNIRREVSRF